RASAYVETASVEDVDAGRERHLGVDATNSCAVAVHTGRENLRAAIDVEIVVIARCRRERGSGSPGERILPRRSIPGRRRGHAATHHAAGHGDRYGAYGDVATLAADIHSVVG